ncbi:zinc finger protein 2 isoform X2 [Daphnia magna]|uniref:Zinc finger protein n=1 Tax=Daphnia magna TaxID=35525 RepID=A0ABR0B7V1_9CRUS|nr:zinc finger protein 2 isoform X2 [Daphnia magna]KAK4037765.1 hypothetical protein OUZ56_029794 [Daphnia magna]
MYVLLVNQGDGINPADPTSIWTCRLCGIQMYNPVYLHLFSESGENPLISTIRRFLDIKIEDSDKLPTTLCQSCTTKVQELESFYNNCQDAQKLLAIQHGVQFHNEGIIEDQALMIPPTQNTIAAVTLKQSETNNVTSSPSTTVLTVDKLLETAIKDTCILSGEESEESESTDCLSDDDNLTDDPSDAEEKEYSIGKRTRSAMFARKSDPPVPRKRKKLVFTLEYLESKLNRKLDGEEAGRLKEYIQKGQNTKIFEMLVGGGKDQVWKCQYCTEEIRGSPKDVKEHYATLHDSVPIFPCQLCDKVCRSVNYYRIHRLSHLAEYPCETCGKIFKDNSKLVLHRQVHSNKRPHECDVCGKTFKRATTVRVHKRTVHGSKDEQFLFTCELCGKRFKTNFELKKHLDKHPSEDNPLPYQCKYCDSRFPDKAQQITHSNTLHANEGEYVCHICGKKVKTETALENHVKSHSGIRDLKCHICDAAFASRYTLNAHVKRHAITEPLFSCPYCGKGSKSKANLEQHIRIHTGVRPYSCSVCNAAFKHRSHLKVHMTIHTGEHPFACHECNKTFRTNKQRTSHMSYVHNTVRNFACEICGKAFKTLKDLKIHSTLHTGEKNHVCPTCGKAFRVRANYYKHRKIHERTSIEQHQQEAQDQSEQLQDQPVARQNNVQPVRGEISSGNVTLPNPSTVLLDNFSLENGSALQVPATIETGPSDSEHLTTHGTSTISDEGVLLFRSSLTPLTDAKEFSGISG